MATSTTQPDECLLILPTYSDFQDLFSPNTPNPDETTLRATDQAERLCRSILLRLDDQLGAVIKKINDRTDLVSRLQSQLREFRQSLFAEYDKGESSSGGDLDEDETALAENDWHDGHEPALRAHFASMLKTTSEALWKLGRHISTVCKDHSDILFDAEIFMRGDRLQAELKGVKVLSNTGVSGEIVTVDSTSRGGESDLSSPNDFESSPPERSILRLQRAIERESNRSLTILKSRSDLLITTRNDMELKQSCGEPAQWFMDAVAMGLECTDADVAQLFWEMDKVSGEKEESHNI